MKKYLSVLLAICLIVGVMPAVVLAESPSGYVTIAVEKFVLGQGYINEPMKVPFYEGDTVYKITERFVDGKLKSRAGMVTAFYDNISEEEALDINPPEYIMDWNTKYFDLEELIDAGRQDAAYLSQDDYFDSWGCGAVGWMIAVNDVFINSGAGDVIVQNGDVIRWQYTLSMGLDIGCDMGAGFWGASVFFTPDDRDALTAKVGEINAAENKDEILDLEGARDAYGYACELLTDLESSEEDMQEALEALLSVTAVSANPDSAGLTLPAQISGAAGTEFNATISVNSWADEVNAIDAVVMIPDGVEVVSITAAPAFNGAEPDFNLDNGVLRFACISTDLEGMTLDGGDFPAELFTLKLRLTEALGAYEVLEFELNSLRLIESAGIEAYAYDVSDAYGSVTAIPAADPVSANARVLYMGDGSDLIPEDKMAVAVEFVNLDGTPEAELFGKPFYYSSELTAKSGVATYVGLLDTDVTEDEMNNAENYTFKTAAAEAIRFADTDENAVVNAQDALNTLSAWLRKTEISGDKDILIMNTSADERIDTTDVLSIIENYVNEAEFAVVGR